MPRNIDPVCPCVSRRRQMKMTFNKHIRTIDKTINYTHSSGKRKPSEQVHKNAAKHTKFVRRQKVSIHFNIYFFNFVYISSPAIMWKYERNRIHNLNNLMLFALTLFRVLRLESSGDGIILTAQVITNELYEPTCSIPVKENLIMRTMLSAQFFNCVSLIENGVLF